MTVVDRWTGRSASALRTALRMTNEAFADYLGAGVRTVKYWDAMPERVLSEAMQETLDAALEQAPDSAQERFALLLSSSAAEGDERANARQWLQKRVGGGDAAAISSQIEDRALAYPEDAATAVDLLAKLSAADLDGRPAVERSLWVPQSPTIITSYLLDHRPSVNPGSDVEADVGPVARQIRDFTSALIDLDYQYGGGYVRQLVLPYFHTYVVPQLRVPRSETEQRQVMGAAARAAQLVGWAAYDDGRHGLALRYFVQGLRLAREARDGALGALLLANLSHQANFLGRSDDAVKFARAGQHSIRSDSNTVMAKLLAMEARGLATKGDERECALVLREAERAFDGRDTSIDPPWIEHFNEAELAGEAAHCFRDLGLPAQTRSFASQAGDPSQTPPRTQGFIQMVSATAALRQRDVDEAVALATESVDRMGPLKSARYLAYLSEFHSELTSAYPNGPHVAEFVTLLRDTHPELERAPWLGAVGP
jgi:hypothetical protein